MSMIAPHLSNPSSQPATMEPVVSNQPPIQTRISPWLASIAYPLVCRLVLPAHFGHIEVIGQEYLPTKGAVILAPTHRSRWDALVMGAIAGRWATGRDLRFMVSADEVKGLQGWFIRRLGGFPVNPRQPAIASLRHGVEILQNQEMLVIFPEGGIFRDRQVHPLKPGLARLALQAEALNPGLGVQIVPISLEYSESFPTWGTNVTVRISPPLRVSDYNQGAAKHKAQQLTQDLATVLNRLSNPEIAEAKSAKDLITIA